MSDEKTRLKKPKEEDFKDRSDYLHAKVNYGQEHIRRYHCLESLGVGTCHKHKGHKGPHRDPENNTVWTDE